MACALAGPEIPMSPDEHMKILSRLMDVSLVRAKVHAANLANQNTPGYRAKAVQFDEAFREALLSGGADATDSVVPKIIEPRNTEVSNDGNDVSMDKEVMGSAQNSVLYNTYMSVLRGQAKLISTAISQSP
jgi:flagellar basal-body rod protein FlgB